MISAPRTATTNPDDFVRAPNPRKLNLRKLESEAVKEDRKPNFIDEKTEVQCP